MRALLSPAGSLAAVSAASLALEVLTPRCLAPAVGTGVPVWTTVVGTVLVALAAALAACWRLLSLWQARRLRALVAINALLLAAAALALYLPAMNLPQSAAVAAQADSALKLPAGIVLASAQISWSAVFSSGY